MSAKPSTPNLRSLKQKVKNIAPVLARAYPDARCLLDHDTPFQLLVATILSAQCTDARVNMVTPGLFKKYPTPAAFAEAEPAELEEAVRSTGFYRNKAKAIRAMARSVVERHGGEAPDTMEALTALDGVGRKTAGVILATCYGRPAIIVDTHVTRVAGRLGLTATTDAVKIERGLAAIVPENQWSTFSHTLGFHGRNICKARKPDCPNCKIARWCEWYAAQQAAPNDK